MGWHRGFLTATLFIAACTPPPRPAPPTTPPLEAKTYSPFAFKSDATSQHHAVLLGTDARGHSTVIPLPPSPAPIIVDAMYQAPTRLTLASSANTTGAVSLLGADVSSTPAWRATLWTSALVAATTLGKDVTALSFSAAPSTRIEDSSTGALVAAGFIAARTGAAPDAKATLTGSLAPDGTLGPVTDLPARIRAALAAGKRTIGIPAGMRTKDVAALATDGATLVEVADVGAAYQLLTGSTLPPTVPVSAADMRLDAETATALDAKYKQWQQRLAVEWAEILQLESAGRIPQLLKYLRDTSKKFAQTAESLHKRGMTGAAYARVFAATLYASTATQAYDILSKVRAKKIDAAIAVLATHDTLGATTKAVFARVGDIRPTTLGGHLQMLASYRAALRGWVFESFATQAIADAKAELKLLDGKSTAELGSDQMAEKVVGLVVPTLLYVGKTVAETTLATEQLEVQGANDLPYTADLASIDRLAGAARAAGIAGIDHVDALIVHPYAATANVNNDDARRRVFTLEPDFLVGLTMSQLDGSAGLPHELATQWGPDSFAWRMLVLSASQLAYASATELLAKYDALGAEIRPDGSGRFDAVKQQAALASMLVTAERQARVHARAARSATGTIPVQAKLAYQNALIEREGTLSDRLDALAQFWAASAYSQTAVMLARN